MGACEHLIASKDLDAPVPQVERGTPGLICPDCRDAGYEVWAHLRMCLTCGHVGCCDSSPYRHASSHFTESGHAVMESFEPGESWRWCYLDRRLLP
ncbi:UBP-type zinc finger domain-containing protein [Actinomycetospora sp. OC33-EN08]|uniref:UBP-type zinc finger domain-containing protein n=1 Tax=Actinomycetospora aurantiaca TaxID=3129233 RepID=A0ABU8MRZ6_9PSEU